MTSVRNMKFCVDCRWSGDAGVAYHEYRCHHPEAAVVSPVDGSETQPRCDAERGLKGHCGREGRLWEPR